MKDQQVVERCLCLCISVGPAFFLLYYLQELLRFFWIIPKPWGMGYFFFFFDLFQFGINVKGTSSALRAAL